LFNRHGLSTNDFVLLSKDAYVLSVQLGGIVKFSLVTSATCGTSIPLLPLTHIPIATVEAPQSFTASSRYRRAFPACIGCAMLPRKAKD
jgi:hypothetical protein